MHIESKFSVSFEFFPPKSEQGMQNLYAEASNLLALQPDYFSVTYGAGGSTRTGTINTIKLLQTLSPALAVPHLSCIGSSTDDILEILDCYKSMGVTQIVALRGDLPSGMGQLSGDLNCACDLVKLIRKHSGNYFYIYVAAYPEIHPQAKSHKEDLLNFQKKISAGANSALTQFFYNPDAYFYFLDECAKLQISIPITPGIMPFTNFFKQVRFADQCGADIPRWIRKRLETYSNDEIASDAFGQEVVLHLCEKLIKGGAPGLHIYALNKAEASRRLFDSLKSL